MKDRYEIAKMVSGTRSFHHFMPLSMSEIVTIRLSEDREFMLMLKFRFGEAALPVLDVVASQYISYMWTLS